MVRITCRLLSLMVLATHVPGGVAGGQTVVGERDTVSVNDWRCVGQDRGCQRYSGLAQIHRDNVSQLRVAWTYHTGELKDRPGKTIECTPLVIEGTMYITTAYSKVVALNAATGEELWQFDPFGDGQKAAGPLASGGVNRGLAYWSENREEKNGERGQRRIIHGTADGRLFSLDADTGKLDPKFGQQGVKDLREDLEQDIGALSYGPTSAPAICRDRIVIGVSCGEGPGVAAPGDIRAFDVRTGKQLWSFRTVPRPGEFGNDTWQDDSWRNRGAANAWGGVSVDEVRDAVYVGTGSAAFDFYGGDRKGANLFANCTIAIDAATGKRKWHFQTLRHDLWDHDLPIYPNLVTVNHNGRRIDAVAQVTKTGFVYLFDRDVGTPLFDIEERKVPRSDVPGEESSPTQPIPVKPPPFAVQNMNADNVTNISPQSREFVLEILRQLRSGVAFTPPSLQGTVVVPGFHGGATWSGASFDPTTSTLFVNSNNVPNIITLEKAKPGAGFDYTHKGYIRFLDEDGYPAIKPPWGQLTAINLDRGEIVWQMTLGEIPELTARGIPQTGTENFGGTIVTAGGLVFIGGTKDERFHAFDKDSGELLWQAQLPAGGYATPCTYAVNGRQFVVIAAGGAGKLGTKAGDAFVAYALPE
ncbi:MAG: pyrroloquinoline quinone-dependent dehydrogenase [Pirellulaceae bacterium]|nr:pyrroloquinoline quinone-dependent dehydrogenase [Planctomycetales bacterium]